MTRRKFYRLRNVILLCLLASTPLVTILGNLMIFPEIPVAQASTPNSIYIDGGTGSQYWLFRNDVGESFTVELWGDLYTDLPYAWEFKLSWNASLLNLTSVAEGDLLNGGGGTTDFNYWSFENETGLDYVLVNCTITDASVGIEWGTLATLTFLVEGTGGTLLDLYETWLWNSSGDSIPHDPQDGYFANVALLYVSPGFPIKQVYNPPEEFIVNVWIDNVSDLNSFGFKLGWFGPPPLLEATEDPSKGPFWPGFFTSSKSLTHITAGGTLLTSPSVNGSGILAIVPLKVIDGGNCTLELYDTTLEDSAGAGIPHVVANGYFSTTIPRAFFDYEPLIPAANQTVLLDASSSLDPDGGNETNPKGIVSYRWDFDDGNVTTVTDPSQTWIYHAFPENKTYFVKLNVTDDEGEWWTYQTQVKIVYRDIAILDVEVSQVEAEPGDNVTVYVTVKNFGTETEMFNVTAYYFNATDTIAINTTEDQLAPPPDEWPPPEWYPPFNKTYEFTWDTTGVALGDYTIKAMVDILPGENNVTNNEYIDGTVTLTTGPPPPEFPRVRVEPSNLTDPPLTPQRTFTVNVSVVNISDLYGWQFYLEWNATLLDFVNVTEGPFLREATPSPLGTIFAFSVEEDNVGMDYVFPACVTQGNYLGVSGNGTLATITFRVEGVIGDTPLHLYNVKLRDHDGYPIEPNDGPPDYYFTNLDDGYFRLSKPISYSPVASFTYSPEIPYADEAVTFNASASYDLDGYIVSYAWNFGDNITAIETAPMISHIYTQPETYIVTLTVTDNDGLTSTSTQSITIEKLNSTISISVSSTNVTIGQSTIISGVIIPTRAEAKVTIWYRPLTQPWWNVIAIINTDANSQYSYVWAPYYPGTYEIKASWPGDQKYHGAESHTITIDVHLPTPTLTIDPTSGPTGTKVTINGSNFLRYRSSISVYLSFDDQLIGFLIPDTQGNFSATFNVPLAAAGPHKIKAWSTYSYDTILSAEATFTVVDTTTLEVNVDVGEIFFKGETVEFFVQTVFKDTSVDATFINAILYKPDETIETLTAERIETGLYKITFTIDKKQWMTGTYTLVVKAGYNTDTVNSLGTDIETFIVKTPWPGWEREAPKAVLSIATVGVVAALIYVWRREKKNL